MVLGVNQGLEDQDFRLRFGSWGWELGLRDFGTDTLTSLVRSLVRGQWSADVRHFQ